MTVHKKHTSTHKEEPKQETKEEIVVSDVVTKTTERIEIVEEVVPESDSTASTESVPAKDPLTDFKERMSEEEKIPPYTPVNAKKNYMWPILFIFIIAIALMAGIFIYKQSMNKSENVNVVSLTPTPTTIPIPTAVADLSKYEIRVLNGSEVNGEAGRQQVNLEAEGFTVSSVGNADKSDYTETIIQAKGRVDAAFLAKLTEVLEESFVVGELEELSSDEESDVIVIIGSETN